MAPFRDWPIRTKLRVLLLALAVPAVLLLGALGLWRGREATTAAAFNQLTSSRVSKARHIESYFEGMRDEVVAVSYGPAVITAMRGYRDALAALEAQAPIAPSRGSDDPLRVFYEREFLPRLRERSGAAESLSTYWPTDSTARVLQRTFLADNPHPVGKKDAIVAPGDGSAYGRIHALSHGAFRSFADMLGVYDIFLIDHRTSRVVYSVFKETDFATRLDRGPYRESGLAKAFAAVRDGPVGTPVLVDFAPYAPSYAAPASFVATPVYDGKQQIGVIAFQVPIDEIDHVMTGERRWRGMGETGETYLVGADRLLRSNSRFWLEDPERYLQRLAEVGRPAEEIDRIRRLGTTILQQEVRTAAVDHALRGGIDTAVVEDYRGERVLTAYTPLDIEGVDWVLLAEMDAAEAFAAVRRFTRAILFSVLLVTLAVGVVSVFATRSFTRRVDALMEGANRVSAGDLDARVHVDGADEFGALAGTFNDMVASVREKTEIIEEKNRQNEELLLNILPGPIAQRLKRGEDTIADTFPAVTVLFGDLVGFTQLSQTMSSDALVKLLNELFTLFDRAALQHGIEKIKTIGDAYMAVAGLPVPRPDHANAIADMALEMIAIVQRFNDEHDRNLSLRVGINTGPVVAGVIGESKFIYDLWGDTVNTASRMESHGVPGEIQVSESSYAELRDAFELDRRGELEMKGKGRLITWLLRGRRRAE